MLSNFDIDVLVQKKNEKLRILKGVFIKIN